MPKVAITQNPRIEAAISEGLDHLAIEPSIRGKVVAVHPNDTWASAQDKTAVTQPDSLRGVIRYLKRFQPKELVVTGGSGAGETDEIFRLVGLMQVIEEEQVTFFDHNRAPFVEVKLDYGNDEEITGPQRSVMVNPRVMEYEALVALNQLKVHATATVTLALKNIAMSYPAADYYGHPRGSCRQPNQFFDDMHSFIAAMAKRFPIHLAITVGHPAMIGYGPIGGYVFETGLAIASTDPVAADVVGAQLLGFQAQAVRHLWEAGRLGLGETELERMDFPAMKFAKAFSVFTEAAYGESIQFEHA
jgi:uncharacterized protein (DUF362 family)